MLAVHGYFDGAVVRPLEEMIAKPNQRVIITIMNDFIDTKKAATPHEVRGILAEYADPELAKNEEGAWERAAARKYGSV